jgi:hypothetical protein
MLNYQVSILITKKLSVPKFISTDPEILISTIYVQVIPFMLKRNRQKLERKALIDLSKVLHLYFLAGQSSCTYILATYPFACLLVVLKGRVA